MAIGVAVPDQRKTAKKYAGIANKQTIIDLLDNAYHEYRLTGLLILCHKFNESRKIQNEKQWFDLYIKKANRVNNWDLVDTSAPIILGQWLEDNDRKILYKWAKDRSIWKNRMAILATFHFIRKNEFIFKINFYIVFYKLKIYRMWIVASETFIGQNI